MSPLNLDFLKYAMLSSGLLAYAFSFNDYCDIKNRKRYFLAPLFLSFLLLPLFEVSQIILTLVFIVIVTIYSAEPFRLKKIPFISSLCNGIGFFILFFIGYNKIGLGLLFGVLLFTLQIPSQLIHEVVHLKSDKREGIITTAVLLGENNVKFFCYIFFISAIVVSVYLFIHNLLNIFSIFSTLIFALYFAKKMYDEKANKVMRKKYLFYGIIVGLVYFLNFLL
jgi:4-hydroxybenzoate polyprenyltransferase